MTEREQMDAKTRLLAKIDEVDGTFADIGQQLRNMVNSVEIRPEESPVAHSARIHCGACGADFFMRLGIASAVVCPGCKTVVRLGEEDYTNDMIDAFRAIANGIEGGTMTQIDVFTLAERWAR